MADSDLLDWCYQSDQLPMSPLNHPIVEVFWDYSLPQFLEDILVDLVWWLINHGWYLTL
jgi:hypothetical protein